MLDTMYQSEGIGLAAQQIGEAIQFCVVDVPEHRTTRLPAYLTENHSLPH